MVVVLEVWFTTTLVELEALPQALLTVTLYVPEAAPLTETLALEALGEKVPVPLQL